MALQESYLSITGPSKGIYKEKGSKFHAFAYPVDNEERIDSHLFELKKEYHDARHHCYAYVLGPDSSRYRANDDGEPKHSAGDPILGQIRSRELSNVLVVVVRYFGGTKLGISGLINAYKTAAADALDNAVIKRMDITSRVEVNYPYDMTNEIMSLISGSKILKQSFSDRCFLEIEIKSSLLDDLISKLDSLNAREDGLSFKTKKGRH